MTSTLGKVDEATETTTEATIHEPPEEEECLRSIQEDKDPKVLNDRAKRTAPDRHKSGKVSTHPVILDTAAQRARQVNAEPPKRMPPPPPPPPPQPSQFATSSATFPGEGHAGEWRPHDPYAQDAQYETSWSEQWRSDSYNHPAPLHDFRPWDGHMPLPYGHQPSSPYTSLLHVPPREPPRNDFEGLQQSLSSSIHFQDFNAFSDAVQRVVQRVSLNSYFILITLPVTGEHNFGA
jgi:hypothetical protein